jgi:hypothetical protein
LRDANYGLHTNYRELTIADNHLNTKENIFMIAYDGTNTQNWGGTTYLTHGQAALPGDLSGTNGNWGGLRHSQNFVSLFVDPSGNTDVRAQFYTTGQNRDMTICTQEQMGILLQNTEIRLVQEPKHLIKIWQETLWI